DRNVTGVQTCALPICRIVETGDNEASGFERYELFVDARDVSEETEPEDDEEPKPRPEQDIINDLISRGGQKLSEYEQEIFMEGQTLTKSRLEYEKDYDLGDIVTLQNKDWNLTLDSPITEIKEIYEASGFKLEATFSKDRPTLIDKVKQAIDNTSPSVDPISG